MSVDKYLLIATVVLLIGIATLSMFQPTMPAAPVNKQNPQIMTNEYKPPVNTQAQAQVVVLTDKATTQVEVL